MYQQRFVWMQQARHTKDINVQESDQSIPYFSIPIIILDVNEFEASVEKLVTCIDNVSNLFQFMECHNLLEITK